MIVDIKCPGCESDLWIDMKIELAEERPTEPEPYILDSKVEDFICHAIDLKLTYSDTGKLLETLRIQPEPGKTWHAHTIRALHRRILDQRQTLYRERLEERYGPSE